jgi:hypothetical protein
MDVVKVDKNGFIKEIISVSDGYRYKNGKQK